MTPHKIRQHPGLNHAYDLQQICRPLATLDIIYFAHVNISANQQFSALSTQPEFFKLYLERGYYNFDVHMLPGKLQQQYIIWDNLQRQSKSKELHHEFMNFNQGHTFTIIEHQRDGSMDCFHFAARLGNIAINDRYLLMVEQLQKFTYYFREKIRQHDQLTKAYDFKFSLAGEQGGYFIQQGNQQQNYLDCFEKQISFDRVCLDSKIKYLTKRELECMHWMANGKNIEMIAKILTISERTVKAHIRNMKDKLDCNSQFQLGLIYQQINPFINIK